MNRNTYIVYFDVYTFRQGSKISVLYSVGVLENIKELEIRLELQVTNKIVCMHLVCKQFKIP